MPKGKKKNYVPLTKQALDPLVLAVANADPDAPPSPLSEQEQEVFKKVVGIEYSDFRKMAAQETRGVLVKGIRLLWEKLQDVAPNYYAINLKQIQEINEKLEAEPPAPQKAPSTVHNHLHIEDGNAGKVAVAELLSRLTGKKAPVSRPLSPGPSPEDPPLVPPQA